MELLDRYLQAVRFWLPPAQQNDIIAELGDDLRSQVEDRESSLGRPLNEDELVALLPAGRKSHARCRALSAAAISHRTHTGPALQVCVESSRLGLSGPLILVWIG